MLTHSFHTYFCDYQNISVLLCINSFHTYFCDEKESKVQIYFTIWFQGIWFWCGFIIKYKFTCSLHNAKSAKINIWLWTKTFLVLTIWSPWYQTSRALSHIKGSWWVWKSYWSKNTYNSRNTSFQCKLYLCFMIVPGCKGHSQYISFQQVCAPACNLCYEQNH